jgi:hypothetical protein
VTKLTLPFSPFKSDIREQMPVDKTHEGPHATQCKMNKLAVPFHISVSGKCPINWQYWLHNSIQFNLFHIPQIQYKVTKNI